MLLMETPMNPSLPPKPTYSTPQPPSLPRQLQQLSINDLSERKYLPFTVIRSDHTVDAFKEDHTLDVPLPPFFEYIPNTKIKEFVANDELLAGYISSLHGEKLAELKDELETVTKSQHDAATDLQDKYRDLLVRAESLATDLEVYNDKLTTFDHLQIEMYDSLNDLSMQSITNFFNNKVKDTEQHCSDILKDASETDGMLSTAELDLLLNDYINHRHVWHEYKECVSKMAHRRVIGLE